MKKSIKTFSLLLAIILSLSIFASCDNSTNTTSTPSSNVPVGGDGKFTVPVKNISDQTEYTEGVYKYLLYDDGTAIIYQHTGNESEIVIPDLLGGYPVSLYQANKG